MPRTGDRGGARTRAHIAEVATRLFLDRGFDAVTMSDVAREAGVARITVFTHFSRKEDLLLDRLPDALSLVRSAIVDRSARTDALDALRKLGLRLIDERHPLMGLSDGGDPFFRTVVASPVLLGRAREFALDVEGAVADALAHDPRFDGDAVIVAALVLAIYRVTLVEVVRARLAGTPTDSIARAARRRLTTGFAAITAR